MTAEERAAVIREWFETDFRDALNDVERVIAATAYLKVGVERCDEPLHVFRVAVAAFVGELIDPGYWERATDLESLSPKP